jgi:outer membrane lipoprotein
MRQSRKSFSIAALLRSAVDVPVSRLGKVEDAGMSGMRQVITFCFRGWTITMLSLSMACAAYQVIPPHLENRIDKDLSFELVQQNPEAYRGRTLILGGKILGVVQEKERTRIEILQLPLDRVHVPLDAPDTSKGRFLAIDANHDITDPAALGRDTLVTVIGEVGGRVTAPLDQGQYDYPVIALKDMTAWEKQTGLRHTPPGSPLVGFRPYVFLDSRRVVGRE